MLYPLLMEPILVPKPWGGQRLARFGKPIPDGVSIGESWEIADLDLPTSGTVSQAESRVANGALTGRTLRSLIAEFGEDIMGTAPTYDGRFPLLLKLLDARQHLSVQVHPTAEYALDHPSTQLKTESWYVVEAEPGAFIYKGFVAGTTSEDVQDRAGSSAIVQLLEQVPVMAGDFHHLPAGTVHALGAGVLVAEVQTPSDTTFRIYDWTEEHGGPVRELHISQALVCLDFDRPPSGEDYQIGLTTRSLLDSADYWVHEHRAEPGTVRLDPRAGARVLMVVDGDVTIDSVVAPKGSTVLIPAAVDAVTSAGAPSVILEIGLGT